MQCQAGAWLAQRYKLLQQLFQDGPMEYWQAQWQDPAGYGGEATLQIPLAIFLQHPERQHQWQRQQHYIHPLQHPNILRLYELGQEQDLHFLASESLQGVTLYQIIQHFRIIEQSVPWLLTAYILARACEGLQFAHQAQTALGEPIYHGDLRPENVLLTQQGEVKLLHFGHLHLWGDLLEAWPIQIKRRHFYAAPERWQPTAPFRPSSDIFSVGVLMYETLTGDPPFVGKSLDAIQKSILAPRTATLPGRRPDLPKTLSALCRQMLSADPLERPQSATEVHRLLDDILTSHGAPITTRDLRALYAQVSPEPAPLSPGLGGLSPQSARLATLPSPFEQPTDYFADDHAPPTIIGGERSNNPFGAPATPGSDDWNPFDGMDLEDEEDIGESTVIQPNLLLEYQKSLESPGGSLSEEVKLTLDPLDPRSRDDLEAPLDLFAFESESPERNDSSGAIPLLPLDDPDSIIEIDDIEEIEEFEEIEEIEVIEDLDGIEVIEDLDDFEVVEELEESAYEPDPSEATFLQGAPLPDWNNPAKPQQAGGPATVQGGLDPGMLAMLTNADQARRSSADLPRAGGSSPAIATIPPASSDQLLSTPNRPIRTHQVDDIFANRALSSRPSDQFDAVRGAAASPPQEIGSPMDLGSLGQSSPVGPTSMGTGAKEQKKSKIWLWMLLLPLIGGGGGTGAWFLWQQLQQPATTPPPQGDPLSRPLPRTFVARSKAQPPKPRVPDSTPPNRNVYNGPDIQPLPLMKQGKKPDVRRRANRRRPRSRRRRTRRRGSRYRRRLVASRRRTVVRPAIPRRPTPPPSTGPSGVLLSIKPSCTVFIGSDVKGYSNPPLKLELAPGSYTFRCINRSKRILHRFRLRVQPNQLFRYTRELRQGTLLLKTKPWSSIHDRKLGKIGKSGVPIKLYQGTFNITLFKKGSTVPGPGMRKQMRVTIQPGKTTKPTPYKFPVLDDEL